MIDGGGALLDAVRRVSARERALARLNAAVIGLAVLAAAGAGSLWLLGDGRWISLPPLLPVLTIITAVSAAAGASLLAWLRWRRVVRPTDLARAIESETRLRRGSVSGLLEIGWNPLSARVAAGLERDLGGRRLAPQRRRRERNASLAAAAALLLAGSWFVLASARNADAVGVLLHPLRAAHGELLPRLRFADAITAVQRGAALNVVVVAPGRSSVRLHVREAGSSWRSTQHPVQHGSARIALGPLTETTTLVASDGRSSSDTLLVRAVDRPFIQSLTLEAVYPAVLRRQPEPLAPAGQILLPEGTTLRVRGRSSVALSSAILHGPTAPAALSVEGNSFAGAFVVLRSGDYRWHFSGARAEAVDPPPALSISVVADLPPEIEILSPRADTTVSGDQPVRVAVRAADDHELSSVVLRVRNGDTWQTIPLAIPPAGGTASVMLDLRSAAPGTRISVEAVASEHAAGRGRTAAASRLLQVMTAAEQRSAARSIADSAATLAAGLAAGQRSAERRTAETAQSRGERRENVNEPAAGHALASRARALIDEQRTLASRADSLTAATRALESRLARAGALDEGLAARLAEVRSLLARALTPALAARLREAEQAAREDAEEPLRRALSDVSREQRRAREQLERVVQMLRRAAVEGSLETLRAEAVELAQRPGVTGEDAQRLESAIESVVARLAEMNARAGLPPARRARESAGTAVRSLAVRSGGGAVASELERAAGSLAEARAAQIAEWKQELAADIDAAVQELVQLASAEESLARRAAGGGEWRREHAALEEGAAAVAERVSGAARASTLVSSRSDGLVRAARDHVARVSNPVFPARDRTQSSALMREAAGALSRAAASLVRDRERTNNARSASGFTELLEELQRLASQQRGLNAATARLPLDLLGGNASGAREQARTLARQQRAIAQALEEIGDADGGARAQPMAAEANRIADALERVDVHGSVLARQERLYHRLLEGGRLLAGDSGEEEERREAVAARSTGFPAAVEDAASTGGRRHLPPGWAELRSLTPAERQMVVEYFERLNGVH